jgi:hypothetical protein
MASRARAGLVFGLLLAVAAAEQMDPDADVKLCRDYVAKHTNQTWRPPAGVLTYPYLVPSGP